MWRTLRACLCPLQVLTRVHSPSNGFVFIPGCKLQNTIPQITYPCFRYGNELNALSDFSSMTSHWLFYIYILSLAGPRLTEIGFLFKACKLSETKSPMTPSPLSHVVTKADAIHNTSYTQRYICMFLSRQTPLSTFNVSWPQGELHWSLKNEETPSNSVHPSSH